MGENRMMILVELKQLVLTNVGFMILLKSTEDERTLPIFIGAAEAQAIAFLLNKVELPRPLTHDLFINTLDAVGYDIDRVEINNIVDGTFFADIVLSNNIEEISIDARPSDAIALSIRSEASIYVDEKVMETAGRIFNGEEDVVQSHDEGKKKKTVRKKVKHISPLKKLEKSIEKAIEEERYEDAAILRDEIKKLKDSHKGN